MEHSREKKIYALVLEGNRRRDSSNNEMEHEDDVHDTILEMAVTADPSEIDSSLLFALCFENRWMKLMFIEIITMAHKEGRLDELLKLITSAAAESSDPNDAQRWGGFLELNILPIIDELNIEIGEEILESFHPYIENFRNSYSSSTDTIIRISLGVTQQNEDAYLNLGVNEIRNILQARTDHLAMLCDTIH